MARVACWAVVVSVLFSWGASRAWTADVVLGGAPKDKVSLQLDEKNTDPAKWTVKVGAKAAALAFTPGAGSVDDPISNGATAVIFGATDCQCIVLGQSPGTAPGWTQTPKTGTAKSYKWKDDVTKSTASVKAGLFKLKKKSGLSYGLDAVPQGEVELQLRFGNSTDTLCTRFAAPANPADDSTVRYKSKLFDTGTAACSPVPGFCGSCTPPPPTTTTTTTSTTTTTTLPCTFVGKWGTNGTGPGQFSYPFGVAVDSAGDVFVADTYNHRVQKFDGSGGFITAFGSHGFSNGQFEFPNGMAIDATGNLWVVDTNNHRIQKFDADGNFLQVVVNGGNGSGNGQLVFPTDLALTPNGDFYVVDEGNNRVQKFDASGAFLFKWGTFGTGDGQFDYPYGTGIDSLGNVYVSDSNNRRIQKFDPTGSFSTKWNGSGLTGGASSFAAFGIAVHPVGDRIFAVDVTSHRLAAFSSLGTVLWEFGQQGSGNGQFDLPNDVWVGADGTTYVVERYNHRVQKLSCP